MRKLIVLIITSVLATGAVAQADTVNVTEDPKDFINILSITDSNGDDVTTLTPSMDGARTYYNLRAEVFQPLSENAIDYFSVCLYDPASLDQSTTLDDLCGYGPGDTDPDVASAKGTNNPKSALQVSRESTNWVHDFEAENANDLSASGQEWVLGNAFEPVATFRGTPLTGNEQVRKASAPVALSHAAANTTGWKVRAVVYFADGTRHELIDDLNTYSVAKYKALDTERTTVDYENVIPGDSSLKQNITTGSYYANHSVDVSIDATKFASGDRPDTEVDFTLAPPDTANAFSLNCTESGKGENNWLSATPNDLMTGEVASNTQTEVEDPKTLPTHDCLLEAGDGVAVGSYSNVVTVGIDDAS